MNRCGRTIALVAALALTSGCGGGGDTGTPDGAVEAYFKAIREGDGDTACGLLTGNALRSPLVLSSSAGGEDCAATISGLPQADRERIGDITARTTDVSGDQATVAVTLAVEGQTSPPVIAVATVKQGDGWKIDGLSVASGG